MWSRADHSISTTPRPMPWSTTRTIRLTRVRSTASSAISSTSRSSTSEGRYFLRGAVRRSLFSRGPGQQRSTNDQRPTTDDSLPRHQRHLMRPVLLDRGLREGKRKGRASVPGLPLVHVIRTEEDSALSRHQVQRAFVKVREVPRQPFGSPKPAAPRLHRVRAPAQRTHSRPREAPNHRKPAEQQMIDFNRIIPPPLPIQRHRVTHHILAIDRLHRNHGNLRLRLLIHLLAKSDQPRLCSRIQNPRKIIDVIRGMQRINRLGGNPHRRPQQNPKDRRNSHQPFHSEKLYRSARHERLGATTRLSNELPSNELSSGGW